MDTSYPLREPSNIHLSPVTKKFLQMFGLKYPIIQAPFDGPASVELAVAIANAGAMGAIPLTWLNPKQSFERIQKIMSMTSGPIFANFVLNFLPVSLDKSIEAGIKTIQFSWGIPSLDIIKKLRDHSITLGIQVSSRDGASRALECEPDYLVCQGIEAGGHVQSSQPLDRALAEVLPVVGSLPVAASGGISTGADIQKYLKMGAAAVVIGTRFVATRESVAHPLYKKALVEGEPEDTVYSVCLNRGWPNATHRILKNSTYNMWNAAGFPQAGQRPGEDDIVAEDTDGNTYQRYANNTPVESMSGDVMALGPYAGLGVGKIRDLPSAGDLVHRLWAEFEIA